MSEQTGGAPTGPERAASFVIELRLAGLQGARDQLHDDEAAGRIDEQTVKSITAELDLTELSVRGGSQH